MTVAAVVYDTEEMTHAAFGKLNPNQYGVLPVLVIIQNDTDQALKMDHLDAEYTNAAGRNVISGNIYYGIQINDTNSDENTILGNYIGLNAAGTASVTNGYSGIGIWDGPVGTVIGGTNAGARNVISGNFHDGINLSYSNVSGVIIQGNYIGMDFSGSNAVPNGQAGVDVFQGAHGMTIGAIDPAEGPKLLYAAQVAINAFNKAKAETTEAAA